ncbi:glyoxylate/hydroxypyruvate reductase HPR3-like [Coffea arabica]|uniref:Glyoxylate/hydroxypyruvate reductase HPR3-like n=1 Tax=Coffea arabica TaxID=13443 RepID=A0A6P6TXR6_COFAR|nr:glyoxylate/hydroxypyruvate reductase HPR3-like [Coffea arabica]
MASIVLYLNNSAKDITFPLLEDRFQFLNPNTSSDSLFSSLAGTVRILLCVANSPVNSETLDKYPSLECVVGSTTGLNHIDLAECRRRGIRVTNAGDAFADDAADYAVGLLIETLRRISAADRFVRAGSWAVKGQFPLSYKVWGKRVGIAGMGSIGRRISKRLQAFGCSIAYNSRKPKANISFPFYASVQELASNVDILVVCCALTNETRHIINRDVMKALGKEGIIVNIGRGSLIDEKEMVKLLVKGEIGGAGLDVFENEPVVPRELHALDNVVLSPHRGGAVPESLLRLQEIMIANIEAFFANKPLLSEIELESLSWILS